MINMPAIALKRASAYENLEGNNASTRLHPLTTFNYNKNDSDNHSETTFEGKKSFSSLSQERIIKSDQNQNIVDFEGPDDPMNAQNWPLKKKLRITSILTFTTMVSVFTSSIFSTVVTTISREYHVSREIGILGLSLYVLGFVFGPNVWAPLSELKGRRPVLVWSGLGFSIFQIGTAVAKDIPTILFFRFWGGFFGAAPIAVVAASFTDIFSVRTRGMAMVVPCIVILASPLIAPFIGGFIVESSLGWRWTQWLTSIMGFTLFFINLIFLEESFAPVILVAKASKLRHKTSNWALHAKHEELEVNIKQLLTVYFSRPIRMLFQEPILLIFSIYMGFIYGVLYILLTAFPIVFQGVHGMSAGIGGLPYFGMVIGMMLGGLFVVLNQASYGRKLAANNFKIVPEWRLPPMIPGSITFTVGIFIFGWTGHKSSIHWIVPTLSGLPMGFGLIVIFIQTSNYLVDTYLRYAASALAANALLRSLGGASFPLFSETLFKNLGINWGCTILGCIALLLIPTPITLYKFGHLIRARSSFNPHLG